MKSFLDFSKERENDELKRQIDHYTEMAEKQQERAEAALMMGDRDGYALFMAKVNHLKTQCENLKGMKEEVEQIDEMDKSQPSSDRGGESSGDPYAKGDKSKPVKTKNFTDKAGKILSQAMNKAYKKNVKEEVELDESTPAWQRKEGKSESGGLNKKGIASYRRENPGSKLSMAVTTKPSKLKPGSKAANRRKSFCARMSGMKKRLTSAKTARDPDSRINKSLRKWNC